MVEALSIVGTVVGIVGGLVALFVALRRRERLRLRSMPVLANAGRARLEITAVNAGLNDVTLTSLGFAVAEVVALPRLLRRLPPWAGDLLRGPAQRRLLRRARRYSDLGVNDGEEETVLLKPSQQRTAALDMAYVASWVHPGEGVWPYLKTSLGREVYATTPADVYVWEDQSWRGLP